MATITATEDLSLPPPPLAVSLLAQVRTFVWLSSGMFSASALALAFYGYFMLGGDQVPATHFLAAIVSAVLFGIATLLKLGPDEA